MTESEQVKALAELDGYDIICIGIGTPGCYKLMRNGECLSKHDLKKFAELHFPPYLTSYNAIIPLIQKQDGETKNLVEDYIEECPTMKTSFWYDATPAQLREALLRATGKWKD